MPLTTDEVLALMAEEAQQSAGEAGEVLRAYIRLFALAQSDSPKSALDKYHAAKTR